MLQANFIIIYIIPNLLVSLQIIRILKRFLRKIQLTIAINFISSKQNDVERVMHSNSDNIEIMINDEADEVIKVFKSLKKRYQNNLELMKGSEFVFNCNHLLYYKFHKTNLNRSGSYIDSPY